ncbi:unnamed protein product [Rotaria magnacalcarata]|uniref:Uncharacterized protein n=1 Tax=Rotaria magnacalcarata TaxID=392030 RepID=A0A8S3E308_9BILA|nr:unnamed protein product [Rotaria magnacalcarata]
MASATTSDENIDDEIMGQMVTSLKASRAEDRKKIADYLQENGVAGYAQFLKGRLEGWKEYLGVDVGLPCIIIPHPHPSVLECLFSYEESPTKPNMCLLLLVKVGNEL